MNIDWSRILLNLRSAGIPVAEVARRVGMDEQTLRNYARGECADPRFSQGVKLLDVHYDHCPDKHDLRRLTVGAS